MTTEKVYSPINDENISNDIFNSPIWKNCYTEEEFLSMDISLHNVWYLYTIKFNGTKPTQVTKVERI